MTSLLYKVTIYSCKTGAAMEIESKDVLPSELHDLSSFIEEKPESLASATAELQAIALRATKFLFDLGKHTTHT